MRAQRRRGWLSLAAASAVALTAGLITAPAAYPADDPVEIVVDGNDVRADNVNGLTYKGLGLLSCNSTSNLLMDHKAEHPDRYRELIRVLFGGKNPLINHVRRAVQPQGAGQRPRPLAGASPLRRGPVRDAALHPARQDGVGERQEHGGHLAHRTGSRLQRGERHRESTARTGPRAA
ncbi:hypothetical protein GCM10010129_39380 [Streptomyces fumigatiscleroticus]|nr:hypothetical protein GCM10010129_39380 [Streptomyces fumigatiscleroticus]